MKNLTLQQGSNLEPPEYQSNFVWPENVVFRYTFSDKSTNLVFPPELLHFGEDAISNVRNAFGVEAIHHAGDDVQLVLNAEIDEIRVDDYVKRRPELRIVLEEQGARNLRHQSFFFFGFFLFSYSFGLGKTEKEDW